jgi:hypothetical protein
VGSLHFLALFWQHPSFIFIKLQTLFAKIPGWGMSTAKIQAPSALGSGMRMIATGINRWISMVAHGTNIDAPYHLC